MSMYFNLFTSFIDTPMVWKHTIYIGWLVGWSNLNQIVCGLKTVKMTTSK